MKIRKNSILGWGLQILMGTSFCLMFAAPCNIMGIVLYVLNIPLFIFLLALCETYIKEN